MRWRAKIKERAKRRVESRITRKGRERDPSRRASQRNRCSRELASLSYFLPSLSDSAQRFSLYVYISKSVQKMDRNNRCRGWSSPSWVRWTHLAHFGSLIFFSRENKNPAGVVCKTLRKRIWNLTSILLFSSERRSFLLAKKARLSSASETLKNTIKIKLRMKVLIFFSSES